MAKPDVPATPEPARPRHRADGGYARGEETRQRLIEAAIRLFGERGYEGASTRDIARMAGVNAPALQYYFDSKEGLYKACMADLSCSAEAHFAPALAAMEAALADPKASRETLMEAFFLMQDATADRLLLSDEAQHRRLFIAQDQAGRGALAEVQESPGKQRLKRAVAEVVARLSGRPANDPLTLLRMMTAQGQLLVFHVVPKTALQSLGWVQLDGEHLALLKQTVRDQTRALIDSWAPPRGD
ncbi:MAG TPA: CerR family C-terminal domain-containing protein [Ideonella sp.]|uniref:CerR family C-terminal domain-containing protein n=1 Tax=Ideonella sp. TaxID=1929293 RepID=UPI002B71EB59|nr:CerR family C-terminal domain-containing protein [Ideonella sp.]HSI48583.1 CerR family C-terminal domain-containing protein [Ideonella sp.]